MKLLLENWRKYLNEGEAQYFPWLKDLPEWEKGYGYGLSMGDKLKDREAQGDKQFKRVGGGSFRSVWAPAGDDDHVIKIAHVLDDHKLQMNKDDFEISKRYPLIFPKAYAHADDFSWIVMEKSPPLIYMEDMQKVLDKSFPAEQEAILGATELLPKWFNLADPFHIMKMIMNSFRFNRNIKPEDVSTDPNDADREALDLQKIIAPVSGRVYQELSKLMHEFAVDKYEIGRGNIGHDKDYNFKIIDSSVFDSVWDSESPE
jgi:hypothetical protein